MIVKVNSFLEKFIGILTFLSVIIGIVVGADLVHYTFLVPWVFAFFSFSSSLGLSIQGIRKTVKKPLSIIVCIIILHLLVPSVAFVGGNLLFPNNLYTIIGLVLAFSIPTGIVSLMWVGIYSGNKALSLSIIIISTLISPFSVPMTLSFIAGETIVLDTIGIMTGILLMVIIPSSLAIVTNKIKQTVAETLNKQLSPFAKLSLLIVIMLNSSVASPYFKQFNIELLSISLVILSISISSYFFGFLLGKLMRFEKEVQTTLMFNSGIRNIGIGAAIATTYFSPPVVLPVVITILFQQILAFLFGRFLLRW